MYSLPTQNQKKITALSFTTQISANIHLLTFWDVTNPTESNILRNYIYYILPINGLRLFEDLS